MKTPYDWTRPPVSGHMPQRRDPARIVISTLAAGAVGIVVFFVILVGYVLAVTIAGVGDAVPVGVGAALGVAAGVAGAVVTWRGIAARWER